MFRNYFLTFIFYKIDIKYEVHIKIIICINTYTVQNIQVNFKNLAMFGQRLKWIFEKLCSEEISKSICISNVFSYMLWLIIKLKTCLAASYKK